MLATADSDGTIMLRDLTTNAQPSILAKVAPVESLAFSPNGEKLASTSSKGDVQLWDIETKDQVWAAQGHRDTGGSAGDKKRTALCVAFSPNGELVASGGGDTKVRLWNASTGKEAGPPLEGHTAYVDALDFSPDGRFLASGGDDQTARVWDMSKRESIETYRCGFGVNSVSFSSDGTVL